MVQRILDFLGMRAYYIVNIPATPLPSGTRNPGGFFMIRGFEKETHNDTHELRIDTH